MVELGARRPDVVGLTADLAKYTDLHLFAQAYPERFFQMGMAEQLLMGAAGGMAPAIIVVHNHPSGDPTPSPDDVALTRAIVQAGKLLDVDVLDHLVIGQGRWVSLKERGLGFS